MINEYSNRVQYYVIISSTRDINLCFLGWRVLTCVFRWPGTICSAVLSTLCHITYWHCWHEDAGKNTWRFSIARRWDIEICRFINRHVFEVPLSSVFRNVLEIFHCGWKNVVITTQSRHDYAKKTRRTFGGSRNEMLFVNPPHKRYASFSLLWKTRALRSYKVLDVRCCRERERERMAQNKDRESERVTKTCKGSSHLPRARYEADWRRIRTHDGLSVRSGSSIEHNAALSATTGRTET